MALRGAPPPDFRYVGLCPGPSGSAVAALCCGVGLGTFALGVGLGGTGEAGTLAAAAIAGGIAALLCGRAAGSVPLERLETHLESYAEEAARPIALDLDGRRGLEPSGEAHFEL